MVNFPCYVLRKQYGDTSAAADGHLHEASESENVTDDEAFGVSSHQHIFLDADISKRGALFVFAVALFCC